MKGKFKLIILFILLFIIFLLAIIICKYKIKNTKKENVEQTLESSLFANNELKKIELLDESKEESKEESTQEFIEKEKYISPIDFEKLKEVNNDIVAWIRIPDTNIDYPIVWNNDNEYYLDHDIYGNKSKHGSIFLDMDNNPDFSSKHNILYGHNMKDKSMFQNIINFKNEKFFNKNRDIYIYTPEREYHLKTIACLYTDSDFEKRRTVFEDDIHFLQYIEEMTKKNKYRQIPEHIDNLWSFITCSYEFYDARTILYAYEVKEE